MLYKTWISNIQNRTGCKIFKYIHYAQCDCTVTDARCNIVCSTNLALQYNDLVVV